MRNLNIKEVISLFEQGKLNEWDEVSVVGRVIGKNVNTKTKWPFATAELIDGNYTVHCVFDTFGRFLSQQWFDYAGDFREGLARVELNGKWNFIDRDVRFLSKQWFDEVDTFNEGFAIVELNRKRNFIDRDGRLLSQQWFDEAYSFKGGFTIVRLNGKWYRINTRGELMAV